MAIRAAHLNDNDPAAAGLLVAQFWKARSCSGRLPLRRRSNTARGRSPQRQALSPAGRRGWPAVPSDRQQQEPPGHNSEPSSNQGEGEATGRAVGRAGAIGGARAATARPRFALLGQQSKPSRAAPENCHCQTCRARRWRAGRRSAARPALRCCLASRVEGGSG